MALLDFVSPAICHHCGLVVEGGAWAPLLCDDCGAAFPLHDDAVAAPYPIARAWAYAAFEGPARRLLIDLKYDGVLRAGRVIGSCMATAPGAAFILEGAELVVPVPLHWWRRWRRGHNQAAVLARALCRGRPELALCAALRRRRATPPQVGQRRRHRLRNVAGAFGVRDRYRESVADRTIVLIDDVITTGATCAAAAHALLDAGATEVRAYAAAWSD
jgi:ComF family protein